jgi:hypothetical protein
VNTDNWKNIQNISDCFLKELSKTHLLWTVETRIRQDTAGDRWVGWTFVFEDRKIGNALFRLPFYHSYDTDAEFCKNIVSGLMDILEGRVSIGKCKQRAA